MCHVDLAEESFDQRFIKSYYGPRNDHKSQRLYNTNLVKPYVDFLVQKYRLWMTHA